MNQALHTDQAFAVNPFALFMDPNLSVSAHERLSASGAKGQIFRPLDRLRLPVSTKNAAIVAAFDDLIDSVDVEDDIAEAESKALGDLVGTR